MNQARLTGHGVGGIDDRDMRPDCLPDRIEEECEVSATEDQGVRPGIDKR
jgi:hypothetical protein